MWKVYSKVPCPWCDEAISLLTSHGVKFQKLLLGVDFTKESLSRDLGFEVKTVPQIIDTNGKLIGGYDDLVAYFDDIAGGFGDSFHDKY